MAPSLVEPRPTYTTDGRCVPIPLAAPERKRQAGFVLATGPAQGSIFRPGVEPQGRNVSEAVSNLPIKGGISHRRQGEPDRLQAGSVIQRSVFSAVFSITGMALGWPSVASLLSTNQIDGRNPFGSTSLLRRLDGTIAEDH
jgi:hypothetical protein